ncbi:hypothetical protein [Nocardia sp. NPDC056100]|uniref:hypothetical protein n=1 Tax=Nocardia sp. NPDC056100 TaxID=3345712 RepID=UPI0035DBD211
MTTSQNSDTPPAADRTVRLRLSGRLGDITTVLADLVASNAFRIEVDDRPYPNRTGLDVRVYAELSLPTEQDRRA